MNPLRMGLAYHAVWIVFAISFLSGTTKSEQFDKDFRRPAYPQKPIVLIPGLLGNRLMAKVNLTVSPGSILCSRYRDWYEIWLSFGEFVSNFVYCWVYELSIEYKNGDARHPMNRTGVEIKVEDFGGTSSLEYLDSWPPPGSEPYFYKFVNYLVGHGYTRHANLKGAPYDWRLTPSTSQLYMAKLKKLVEETFAQNSNTKVVMIGHSMGNLFTYYFLKHQPQEWKDKFIDSFISINSPYLGAVKDLKSVISGETENHDWVLSSIEMRKLARTFPSSYLLLPRPSFWPKQDSVLVKSRSRYPWSPKQNYTVNDYKTLFKHIGCEECWERWQAFGSEMGNLSAPNVKVHCIYSSQIPTAETLIYDMLSEPPTFATTVSGDGSVPTFSSSYCLNWRKQQRHPVYDVPMPGNTHDGILDNSTLHHYIRNVTKGSLIQSVHFDLL